jgi:HK97 gp10 family phage protein
MSVKMFGFKELTAELNNIEKRSSRGVRSALLHGSEKIRDLAKQYAPVDEGNLEESIKVAQEKDITNSGRSKYYVFVDENQPAEGGKTVGFYATRMHEGDYRLGKGSQRKADSSGLLVGRKFLERAMEDLEEEIKKDVEQNLERGVGH